MEKIKLVLEVGKGWFEDICFNIIWVNCLLMCS